jgi:hypothetical protein
MLVHLDANTLSWISPFLRSMFDAHCHQAEGAETDGFQRYVQTHPFLLNTHVLFHNVMGSVVGCLAYIFPVD